MELTGGKPIVALDIDGVINVLGAPKLEKVERHEVEVSVEQLPRSSFLRGGGEIPLSTRVHIPKGLGEWLQSINERCELIWATTWEKAANHAIAPLLGIGALPVLELGGAPFGYQRSRDSVGAKNHLLGLLETPEYILWLDDNCSGEGSGRIHQERIEATEGLTERARARVESWLSWAESAGRGERADTHGLAGHNWRIQTSKGELTQESTSKSERASWSGHQGDTLSWESPLILPARVGETLRVMPWEIESEHEIELGVIRHVLLGERVRGHWEISENE